MGKKEKSKEKKKQKKKNAIFKGKYVPVKKKDVMKKAEAKQKGSKKPKKALEQEYRNLALKYQGLEGQAASMLEHISQLQLASREVKDSLARETENAEHLRNRLESLETGKHLEQEALAALRQQVEQQADLVSEAGSRLEAVERLGSQGASLREQLEYLQAGKSEMEVSIGNLAQEGNALKSAGQELGSRVENLSSSFDAAIERVQESAGRDRVIETWMENLNRADSDLSLQMGQQQERVQGLVERSEKLDQAAHEITESYRVLQEQVRDLSRSLIAANEQLEEKTQRLDSDFQHLAARHGRLAGSVLVAGILLLALGAVVYWAKFGALDDRTSVAAQQIERISEQVGQHERRLADQEQQISASKEMAADRQGLDSGDLAARFESMNRGYEVMDERLKDFTQVQHEVAAKYVQLGEKQVKMGRQLAETQEQLAALAASKDEQKPEAKQQEQNPRPQPVTGNAQGTGGGSEASAWLQGLNPRHYTIQIFAAYDASVVSRVAAREDLQEAMAIYKGEFNQRDWYVLLYGEYSSIREARSAIQSLPEDIRAGGPWVRKLSSIQDDRVK